MHEAPGGWAHWRRRGVLAAALGLAGCGFRPVYGTGADGSNPVLTGFSQTIVSTIPERQGQLLRQALQDRLERGGAGGARLYDLRVAVYAVSNDQIGIQQDSNPTRVRMTGKAIWSLLSLDAQQRTLTHGVAVATDGYDNLDMQYFAGEEANAAAQRRLALAVADALAAQLAHYFTAHSTGA
jgi:LPS-assembly lipoprotein